MLDIEGIKERIEEPVNKHSVKFKQPSLLIMDEMIMTKILEESVGETLHKKHIIDKYIMQGKKNSILASRTKLDSMRFNYSFGDKYIDSNEKLKAFMTRNMEKRRFKRTPLNHELTSLTLMVDELQKNRILSDSFSSIKADLKDDPTSFLNDLSPQFKSVSQI